MFVLFFYYMYIYTDTFLPSGIVLNEPKDKKFIWERVVDVVAEEEEEEEEKTIHSIFVAR